MQVKPSNDDIYKVTECDNEYVVNMESKRCTCNHFQIDEFPCSHALAVVREKHMCAYDFCSYYYTKEAMLSTYQGIIYPIPKQCIWELPTEVEQSIVNPPVGKRKSGRPKKTRIKSSMERHLKCTVTCSKCKQSGHNKKTCRNAAREA